MTGSYSVESWLKEVAKEAFLGSQGLQQGYV